MRYVWRCACGYRWLSAAADDPGPDYWHDCEHLRRVLEELAREQPEGAR